MILIRDAKERTRFLKFAVVGTIGFVVDFSTYNLVRNLIGFSPEVSSIISFSVAVLSNFLFNRYWTYPDSRSKPIVQQLAAFSLVNVAGLIIRTLIFSLIHEPMGELFAQVLPNFALSPQVLGENISLAIVVVIVMFWNFFANRYWTYNDVD
ncbi:GtrA family protein [bacterium]|nr:GtrA family protein [bacterium]